MKLKIAANCIRGNKRRSNEDMVLVGESRKFDTLKSPKS